LTENTALRNELFSISDSLFYAVKDGNPAALEIFLRRYSARRYKDGRARRLFVGPGEKLVLLSRGNDALFVWRKFIDASGQKGVNCSFFRNEGAATSSLLILEAERLACKKWPGHRLYTYVNPKKVNSTNPGYCFLMAGWTKCGFTKGGLLILEKTFR
jgi:hypothetical protein